MNDNERELDLALAEAEQENRLLRARNERLEREILAAAAKEAELMDGMTIAYMSGFAEGKDAGIDAEREACVNLAASLYAQARADEIESAIRARGQG
jgi:hypothetical protein